MVDINVKFETKELTRWLLDVEKKQIPFATSQALNKTAYQAHKVVVRVMRRVFDRPTPWFMKRVRYKKSTYKKGANNYLTAVVSTTDHLETSRIFNGTNKDPIIAPHIRGGSRKPTRIETLLRNRGVLDSDEYLVPSKYVKKNRYGNVARGIWNKMMSDLGAQLMTSSNGKFGTKAKFFVGTSGQNKQKMIMWRKKQRGGVGFVPVFIIVKKPHYKKRFDLERVVNHTVRKHYSKNFKTAFAQAMRTAR